MLRLGTANGSGTGTATGQTIGIDVGDTWSQICVVEACGTVVEEARVRLHHIEELFERGDSLYR